MMGIRLVNVDDPIDQEPAPFVGYMFRFGWKKPGFEYGLIVRDGVGVFADAYAAVPAGWSVSVWYRGKFEDERKGHLRGRHETRAEAIEAAKRFGWATKIPFVEFSERPDATAGEARRKVVRDGRRGIVMADSFAHRASDVLSAVTWWTRSAERCVSQMAVEPLAIEHYRACALSRLNEAARAIKDRRIEIAGMKRNEGFKVVRCVPLPGPEAV